jgi:hypothetical protein
MASGRVASYLVARPIEETQHIAQTIMGTHTEGRVVTKGRIDARFVPADEHAVLEFRLMGSATMDSCVGHVRRVTIFSSSRTEIDAVKRIFLTSEGVRWLPSDAHCSTQIAIHAIEAQRRIAERIAWRRAARTKGSVEQAASRQAERRTVEAVDRLADRGLESGNDVIRDNLGPSARKLDLKSRLRVRSTATQLRAQMFLAQDIPVRLEKGPSIDDRHDVAIVLHEALVGDVAETLLAGTTVRDDELLSMMKLLTGSPPRPLWVHDREPRWSVTLAEAEPLSVRFSNGGVRFRLYLDRVAVDGRETAAPTVVAADYKLEISRDGPHLSRRGPVQLLDESDRSLSQPSAAQQLVRRKFRGVFLPEIRLLGLIPPAGSNWEPLRALELKQLTSQEGWLSLGYQIAPDAERSPLPVSLTPLAEAPDDSAVR